MKKIKVASLAAGAAILAMAGMANATPLQFNLVGASAQFDYWAGGTTPGAANFLRTQLGCTAPDANLKVTGKFAYIKGTNCNPALVPAANTDTVAPFAPSTIEFRVTGQASVEGMAVNGTASQYPTVVYVTSDAVNYPCDNTHKRSFNIGNNTLGCMTAHVGAFDLDPSSITQASAGQIYGPMNGGAVAFNHAKDDGVHPGLNVTGLTKLNAGGDTFAVPFGLFVNNAVQAHHCTVGNIGDICSANSDCGTGGACDTVNFTTINNLSRLQVAMLFSGQTADWSDFGPAYKPLPSMVCLRHAGSGTAAAFDNMVMTAGTSGWGAGTAQVETTTVNGPPVIYFNDTTDTELACINGNTVWPAVAGGGAAIGAVGYADADKGISGTAAGQENLKKIKYNGMWPSASNIKNGVYDWYSIASFYINPANGPQNIIANQMLTYITTGTIPTSKSAYWAQTRDMVFKRGVDLGYPARQ